MKPEPKFSVFESDCLELSSKFSRELALKLHINLIVWFSNPVVGLSEFVQILISLKIQTI